jgi:carbamoyl-phosphate synthase large subunit
VSKTTGHNFARIAVEAMLGKDVRGRYQTLDLDMVAVKSPQFSYARLKGADPVLDVEMASTGEVAAFGDSYGEALLLSMLSSGFRLPGKRILVSLGGEENKEKLLPSLKALAAKGFSFFATEGTSRFLGENGIPVTTVYKVREKKDPNLISVLDEGKVDLIINISARRARRGDGRADATDGFMIRRRAVDLGIALITNRQLAEAFVTALIEHGKNFSSVKAWDEYQTES